MIHVHEEYQQPFLIEPTKLARLLDAVHARLGRRVDHTLHDTFEVFLMGNRLELKTSLNEVLALENAAPPDCAPGADVLGLCAGSREARARSAGGFCAAQTKHLRPYRERRRHRGAR